MYESPHVFKGEVVVSLMNNILFLCVLFQTIQFYENSLRAHDVFPVRYALASVYFKLKEFDKAKKIASNGIDNSTGMHRRYK